MRKFATWLTAVTAVVLAGTGFPALGQDEIYANPPPPIPYEPAGPDAYSPAGPAAQVQVAPPADARAQLSDQQQQLLTDIEQGRDPSATIDAYSRALANDPENTQFEEAFVRRMVELGAPQLAKVQAADLTERTPENGLAWAVLAFNSGADSDTTNALKQISAAVLYMPDDPFVLRTAGQLIAWYDAKGDPQAIPADLRESLTAIKSDFSEQPFFKEAYNDARQFYAQADAEATGQDVAQAPAPPPQYTDTDGQYAAPATPYDEVQPPQDGYTAREYGAESYSARPGARYYPPESAYYTPDDYASSGDAYYPTDSGYYYDDDSDYYYGVSDYGYAYAPAPVPYFTYPGYSEVFYTYPAWSVAVCVPPRGYVYRPRFTLHVGFHSHVQRITHYRHRVTTLLPRGSRYYGYGHGGGGIHVSYGRAPRLFYSPVTRRTVVSRSITRPVGVRYDRINWARGGQRDYLRRGGLDRDQFLSRDGDLRRFGDRTRGARDNDRLYRGRDGDRLGRSGTDFGRDRDLLGRERLTPDRGRDAVGRDTLRRGTDRSERLAPRTFEPDRGRTTPDPARIAPRESRPGSSRGTDDLRRSDTLRRGTREAREAPVRRTEPRSGGNDQLRRPTTPQRSPDASRGRSAPRDSGIRRTPIDRGTRSGGSSLRPSGSRTRSSAPAVRSSSSSRSSSSGLRSLSPSRSPVSRSSGLSSLRSGSSGRSSALSRPASRSLGGRSSAVTRGGASPAGRSSAVSRSPRTIGRGQR
jgi:hypothetical protein